jgi:hypothetical protein
MSDHIPGPGKMVSARYVVARAMLDSIGLSGTSAAQGEGNADAILAALAAAGRVIEQDWQPIATAPKDGTRLLCFAPAAEDRASLVRSDFWWVRERAFAHMRPGQPYTHWRPLPTPPAAAKETKA